MQSEPLTLAQELEQERSILAHSISRIQKLEALAKPPVVQEIVLARRAAEDSRMRLGVALAHENGNDPLGLK